jgi:nucleoside-diphosphate-sugar epimerase
MQTILGSGGAIGVELAKSLPAFTDKIRLVSRNPKKVNANDDLFSCDLGDTKQVMEAVKGSSVVYLTAGLVYSLKIWQVQWPLIMRNVVNACKRHQANLVFFDNIYMVDSNHIGNITEDSPINPASKKGKIRAELDRMILDEVKAGDLEAIIARAADFYGPNVSTSVLVETVYKNLLKGKAANWFCSFDKVHSFTYTPDAGRATAILGNDPKAFNQIWNLPTAENPMTGREWIDAFAKEMNVKPRRQLATPFIVRIMGLFMPIMREFVEMLYQYDRDYVFNSSKFERAYGFEPTPYLEGIREIVLTGKS